MKTPLLVLWALSLSTTVANADTFRTFAYQGTFATSSNGPIGSVNGGITIDTTTGVVTSATPLMIEGSSRPLTQAPETDVFEGNTEIFLSSIPVGGFSSVTLVLPVTTLVGYTGSILCTDATEALCPNQLPSVVNPTSNYSTSFIDGSIRQTAAITITPEPSTLALLGTGILALAGKIRRRYRS